MSARLGLSPWAVLGLAALGVPRVVAHDLGPVGGVTNTLLVFVPILVWLGVVVSLHLVRPEIVRPFTTLLAIGSTYGVLVGVAHQLLWPWAFDTPPRLGGNLAGAVSPTVESLLLRTFAFGSSLLTGVAVGVVVGAAGWVLVRLAGRWSSGRLRHYGP
ncbi:hypothetical protein SAMN05216207_104611 [Pseudonocardia ammonioxydans]|uniref:Uncharacterized protein n=1 Tax=Pseudonocardia ammonioxydans TaxID=260086 RepID=A0A1I5GEW0_PSUAM|nr:hypothetical protein [Pseudonocardia ammonioxydans]SFO34437.1 hypothetical protein SAMN05216207_104611 [Pseudonocardia ammonioxydans]